MAVSTRELLYTIVSGHDVPEDLSDANLRMCEVTAHTNGLEPAYQYSTKRDNEIEAGLSTENIEPIHDPAPLVQHSLSMTRVHTQIHRNIKMRSLYVSKTQRKLNQTYEASNRERFFRRTHNIVETYRAWMPWLIASLPLRITRSQQVYFVISSALLWTRLSCRQSESLHLTILADLDRGQNLAVQAQQC